MIDETKLIEELNRHKSNITELAKRKRLLFSYGNFNYYIDKLIELIDKLKVEEEKDFG